MAEKTNSQINEENLTTIDALGTYLDYAAPVEQFGSNFLGRIAKIQPIQTQEDLVERGLIGADGLLTPQGELFKTLNDNKFINTDGTLSEKSTAFLMDEDDALRPENLNAWRIRKQNKIGETPSSWGDTFGSLGELLYDAGVGLGTMVKLGVQNALQQDPDTVISNLKSSGITFDEEKVRETLQRQSDQLLNKSSVAATSFVENSIKAFSETGAIIDLGGAWALSLPSRLLGHAENATELVDTARQFQERLIKSNQDAAIGSTLDAVFQTATYVDEMARVKAEMPKAEFDQTIKQTAAAGQIFADPMEMAKIGTVLRLSTKPIVSRLTLNAERVIGKAAAKAARLAQIDVDIADVERAKGMAQNAAELAKRTGEAARERFDLNGDQNLLRRANTAEDIFNRSSAQVGRFTDDGIRLADEAAQLTADSQRLASRIPVAAAQSYEAAAKAGRGLKAMPFKTFAGIVEPVGRGIIALDDGLDSVSKKLGIGAAYNILTSKVGQAVGYGAAVGLGPVPAAIGAAGSILKSGPFLQRLADTSRIMGTEMAKAQSQIPFFQRVANNPMISPAHRSLAHLADAATLGGFLPNISRRAVKGAALSFPLDFAAQYMSDGGEINQNTFKQAVAESVLIGGSSASLGGMFAGTKQRHKELSVNDEINFRNEITAPDQKALFTLAPSGIRRAIGTFSAVFPSVNIELTESGGGFHDDNTIGIDLNSSNPLKYLLAHEVKHLLVHRNQMHMPIVAMMLGDGETGGLMRSPDGTLNPEFEAFSKEYNSRQIASGRQPVSLGKLAEEFFVEAGVDDMVRIAESGELGAIASRTEARRMIGRLFSGIFDKSTVLKDFHLRIGGLMDQGGRVVQGSGLLDSGLTQTQEMRNMTRNMLSRAAGRSVGAFQPLGASNVGNKGEGPGINLPITPGDKAMIEKIGPVEFEMETVNGQRQVARDSNGDPIPIDFNTQLMRSRTGALIQEAIGNRPSTYQSSPGEMRLNDEGIWEGYLPPDLFEYIKRKGSLNQEQIRMIDHVNGMIKNFKGDVAVVINHPATGRNKKGKLNYKTLRATLRQVTPISWTITKDGNLMLGLMSVTQLKSNIDSRISSKLGQKLYQGNRAKLMIDIGKVMELHQKGKRTDAYFDKEYGAAKSQQFKNFVNSVFGLITKKQGDANPIFSEENLSGNGVYKTYRADRISQATKITGDKYPFQYDFVVQNMMPNGLPTLDEQGRPVAQNRLPEPIDKKLQNEITQLQDQIDRMYESGRTDGVEDLEEKLETLLEKSETDMAAMQMESMQEFDDANPSQEEQLVTSWYRWTGKGLPDESADLQQDYPTFGAFVRASLHDMVGKVKDIGTLNENISDKQIEDAAKESAAAYERRRDALKSSAKSTGDINRLPEPADARLKKKRESDSLKVRQTKKTLADWAFGQASWKDWYSEHQETLDDFFGDHAELFQEILAVTSQASSVKANVGLALKAFGQLMRNEEFDGKLRGEEKSGYLPAVISNLNAIKNKAAVGGRKISNYKDANSGDTSKVVVDRHIARMLFGVDTPSAKQYAKAEKILTKVAESLGWEPSQVQAALWAHSIVASGKDPVSYGAYLKSLEAKKLTKKQLINGIKGNQLTARTGEIAGSSYGSNELSKERGRYSPASQAIFGGDGGGVNRLPEPMKKPYGPNDPLPSFQTTVVRGETNIKGFKFDKATNVVYDIGGGKKISFSFDPAYLIKPKFADPKKILKGLAVIMLEADKARATGGDMGGVNFPNLRSNQVTVTGPDGIEYRVKWANMTSAFVSGSKNRMQSHGAKYALIQLMDDFALKSNKRTARTLDKAMRDAGLSVDENNMIAMAMNYGIIVGKKAKLSSTVTALKKALPDADANGRKIINEKIKKTLLERESLNPSPDEMEIFKAISNVKTAMSNVATGRWKQATVDRAFVKFQSFKLNKAYNDIIRRIKSPYVYDNIGSTFTDRGSAVGSITSVKLGNFDVKKIMIDSSDFKEAKNLDIVSAVELSQNPDFFALYFGKDPIQESAMSEVERSARDKMLADNNFQVHESYDWAMMGPANGGDFIFNKPVRPEDIFKNYRNVHEKISVKSGSEETVAGAMRKSAEYKLTAYGNTVKVAPNNKVVEE